MSYLRLATGRSLLLARQNTATWAPARRIGPSFSQSHHCEMFHSQVKQRLNSTPSRNLISPTSNAAGSISQQYTTSAKPHMTKSMLKWKRRKRKSKAQQQKELESLQRDLVKLLSKRAIQVVKNKSLWGAQRDVVTSHAFNHLDLHDSEKCHSLVEGTLSPMEMGDQSWSRHGYNSDYVARMLEARLKLNGKNNSTQPLPDLREHGLSNAELNATDSNCIQNESIEKVKEDLSPTLHGSHPLQGKFWLSNSKPITYSELFPGSMPPSLFKYPEKCDSDFNSSVKSFTSELSSVNSKGSMKSRRDWDSEILSPGNIPERDVHTLSAFSPSTPSKDRELQRDVNLSNRSSSSPKQMNSGNDSKNTLVHGSRTAIPPSIFVHDPVDGIDDFSHLRHLQEHELEQGSPNSRQSKNTTLKKNPTKGKANASPKAAPTNVFSQELREMVDKSFVEASCFTGCELLAVRNLQYHATKSKLTTVHVFNVLIHALAKKGDLQTIKSLFLLLRQQGLEPTLQTYAACLECMGRMPEPDVHSCENILADVKKSNLDLADIARKCRFQRDEWDNVLKAIKLVQPDFTPNPIQYGTKYDNQLLLGLNSINEEVIELNQFAIDASHEEMMARAKTQLDLEVKGEVKVKCIAAADLRETLKPKTRELRNALLAEWRKVLLDSFDQKVATFEKNAQDNINMTLYPFLKLLPREEYVNIIFKNLKDLLTMSAGYSPTMAMIKNDLGWAVNRKYNTALRVAGGMDEKVMAIYDRYMLDYLDKDKRLGNHRLMWMEAMGQNFDTINLDLSLKRWPGHIIREMGKFLLDMILYDLKVNANTFKKRAPKQPVPAFCTMVMSDKATFTTAELKLHPVVSRLFAVDDSEFFSFTPCVVPMLVPPVPWISRYTGSLLLGSNALVRMRLSTGYVDPLKSVKESQYSAVLDSLNTLSSCAWNINKPILDLQVEVFNNKGDAKLKVPPPASQFPPLPVIKQGLTPKEKAQLYKERLALQQQRQDAHGLWCTDLYRLSIANKFRDEVFWFPHSMDFRGRTYPLPPHFNHLGSDNVRGMLLFAKGKPLGEKGYDWLKIHLINLTGLKKRSSNAERLEFADSVMQDILDSADRPLTGKKWWQASDEPWQTLACCMEIAKIERFEGNKADYMCHFPVHQDGSCNGLQHYAAIGRDQAGAESVNLHPFEVPKDVYSDVVDLVEKARQTHAEEGKEIAQVLEGFIKRKVIKQTIMTTVYGVTRYGAREQIHRQLKDIPEFPPEESWRGSMYLTQTTFSCLREMFTAAKDIQDWLTEASSLISAFMPVDWITPLGFPVMQPYFKQVSKHSKSFDRFKPNTMKQKNAFPPNYIHSLDSTHMMLTALYCVHAGITFVSVHDCYWTHACDVPIMNKICREQFVSMHKQPLLEDLSEHLIGLVNRASRDPNLVEAMKKVDIPALLELLRNVPKRGTFDLDNVLKSTYFFS